MLTMEHLQPTYSGPDQRLQVCSTWVSCRHTRLRGRDLHMGVLQALRTWRPRLANPCRVPSFPKTERSTLSFCIRKGRHQQRKDFNVLRYKQRREGDGAYRSAGWLCQGRRKYQPSLLKEGQGQWEWFLACSTEKPREADQEGQCVPW